MNWSVFDPNLFIFKNFIYPWVSSTNTIYIYKKKTSDVQSRIHMFLWIYEYYIMTEWIIFRIVWIWVHGFVFDSVLRCYVVWQVHV